jgi:voltage-gated potassium channel Kch
MDLRRFGGHGLIVVLTPPFLPAALQAARVFRLLRLLRLLGGGAAFSVVEESQHLSAWDGVWWTITTATTTVGYGDIEPMTTGGRAIAVLVMFTAIGLIAVLTAAAADRFLRERRAKSDELQRVEQQLDEVLRRLDQIERTAGVRR